MKITYFFVCVQEGGGGGEKGTVEFMYRTENGKELFMQKKLCSLLFSDIISVF